MKKFYASISLQVEAKDFDAAISLVDEIAMEIRARINGRVIEAYQEDHPEEDLQDEIDAIRG